MKQYSVTNISFRCIQTKLPTNRTPREEYSEISLTIKSNAFLYPVDCPAVLVNKQFLNELCNKVVLVYNLFSITIKTYIVKVFKISETFLKKIFNFELRS